MIRPMIAKDIVHVQQIARVTWSDTYSGIFPEALQSRFIDRTYSDAMLMKRLEKTLFLIVECEGIPVGFANFTEVDNDGDTELTAMYILPTHQRSGYGQKLMQVAFTMLTDAVQLFVYVDGHNTSAREFYEKQGFQLFDVFEETFEGHPTETAQYIYTVTN